MKKWIALLLMAVMLTSLFTACGEGDKPNTTAPTYHTGTHQPQSSTPPADTDISMALVVAGSFGDRSFYDSSKEGADKVASELGVEVSYIECNNDGHTTHMQNAAEKADIVVCVGWEFFEINTVAPLYPNVKFIWIDNATDTPIPNVLNITYAQNEGSFLAGYIAAAMSTTGVIGAVGGEDSDTINDFIVGYEQGAAYYSEQNEDPVKVVHNYTNSYDDPTTGKNCAMALIDQKADVIFQIASAAGDGVFEAAKEKGIYAIGVDSDQKYIDEEVIICSMKKEVGESIFHVVKKFVSGDNSMLGTTWVADMSSGYVGIGYGEEGSVQQIPDELKTIVAKLATQIANCSILVDTTR